MNDAAPDDDPAATLAAWRERGDHRLDPVRFRYLESMARRSERHRGEARRRLDAKLATLLAAYRDALARAAAGASSAPAAASVHATRGPLAALVDEIARDGAEPGDGHLLGLAATPELKTLRYFRSTWSRLSADQRVHQSQKQVPAHAGPLNSQHLVHRMLSQMREASPGYLQRFMAYVDALSWLERAHGGPLPVPKEAPAPVEPATKKKSSRRRRG